MVVVENEEGINGRSQTEVEEQETPLLLQLPSTHSNTMKTFTAAASILALAGSALGRTFTVYNACPFTIWPAVFVSCNLLYLRYRTSKRSLTFAYTDRPQRWQRRSQC